MKNAQASRTAKVIAASTILLDSEQDPEPKVAPGAAELCEIFLSGTWTDRCLASSARCPLTRALWRCLERWTLPGIITHYWARKRWIESRCRNAIAAGAERLVILGAGFDTLGIRLAREFKNLQVVEIDHPATQRAKKSALFTRSIEVPENFHWQEADLMRDSFPAHAFGTQVTACIMEGVLMYLPQKNISALLESLHQTPAERLILIFSFMSRYPSGRVGFRPHSRLIELWLAWSKEPFTWAMSPEKIDDFLTSHDFKQSEMALTREFRDEGSALEGENLIVCERQPRPARVPQAVEEQSQFT
jgi:methyltransferase (TIGR00027 family)